VLLSISGNQFHVVNHLNGEETENATREIYQESSRIYRGKIHLVCDISPKLLDAVIIPGGQGPIKNFLGGTEEGGGSQPAPEIEKFLRGVHEKGGAIGAISLAEFVLTRIFGPIPGGRSCLEIPPTEVLSDIDRKLFVTPGNLSAKDLPELQIGLRILVTTILEILE
jgi:enhancing lycopene biosynthesis protein 2